MLDWLRDIYADVLQFLRVQVCRLRYQRILRLLRKRPRGEKIKVLFLSSNNCKWKSQSLYDLMKDSDVFDPVIGLTVFRGDLSKNADELRNQLDSERAFYERHGNKCVDMIELPSKIVRHPSDYGAQIVFPQEQWSGTPGQSVWEMSRYALVCYMPYSIESPKVATLYFNRGFHGLIFCEFMWSEDRARYCRRHYHWWNRVGEMVGTGHTSMDYFYLHQREKMTGDAIIYAPHYSFTHPNHHPFIQLSTFTETGKAILAYAQSHPEIRWYYKPHPSLYSALEHTGAMTKAEIEAYDKSWKSIATACYDGDYQELFCKSRALVTDCGSFLFEYPATGNPVIRLIPDNVNTFPCPAAEPVCNSFYNCHTLQEMYKAFDTVIRDRKDPKLEERQSAMLKAGLVGHLSAKAVMEYLEQKVGA